MLKLQEGKNPNTQLFEAEVEFVLDELQTRIAELSKQKKRFFFVGEDTGSNQDRYFGELADMVLSALKISEDQGVKLSDKILERLDKLEENCNAN